MKPIHRHAERYKRGRLGLKQKELKEYMKIEKKQKTYSQDWSAYNQAQQSEKIYLMKFLDELLSYAQFPERKGIGRKPVSHRDKIFYITFQAYNIKSSRRCIADLEIARKLGFTEKRPHFNTVLKCLNDPSLIKYMKHLINVSGLPLQQIENNFAVDSSGFSISQFDRWIDVRFGGKPMDVRRYKKVHLTCGTKTNIITAVNITKGNGADSPQFKNLILETRKVYNIKEVSADKAYSSKDNLEIVSKVGGIAYIPFKKNTSGRARGSYLWMRMYKLFLDNNELYMNKYHLRSNSESVFHSLKMKFGSHLRTRNEVSQTNEILAKCLAYNICVLIQEMFELGIEVNFEKCANIEIAHK